ncbi:MAG TPA: endonuclease, partial [Romboutsia sp.]|nr:endonuclease [Romboutsia sp.]
NEKNININNFYDIAVYTNKYKSCTFEKTNARIDYIFVDKLITIDNYIIDLVQYSDHYPVIGNLR